MTLTDARSRSMSHDEIVAVEYANSHCARDVSLSMIEATLAKGYSGEIDAIWLDDGRLDIWGYQLAAPEGKMDWRLHVTIT